MLRVRAETPDLEQWPAISPEGLRRVCRRQWGQRAEGANYSALGVVSYQPREHQPARRVEWLEWMTAINAVDRLHDWTRGTLVEDATSLHNGIARAARGRNDKERREACKRLSSDVNETFDALGRMQNALQLLDEADLEPKLALAPVTRSAIRDTARLWERSQMEIEDAVQRRVERDATPEAKCEPIQWMSPQVRLENVRALTTPEDLARQGENQRHCVGGYVPDCLNTQTPITSMRSAIRQRTEPRSGSWKTTDGLPSSSTRAATEASPMPARVRLRTGCSETARGKIRDESYDHAEARRLRAVMRMRNQGRAGVRIRAQALETLRVMSKLFPDLHPDRITFADE